MKFFYLIFSIVLSTSISFARDPGTGSNTTVGPGPATPDAGSSDTSIMGGGTPGNSGESNLDQDEPQERQESRKKAEKKIKKDNITNQNSSLDSL